MDEFADIYYVDSRNARQHPSQAAGWRPSGGGPANSPSRTVIVNPSPAPGYAPTPYVRPMAPGVYPAAYAGYPVPYPGQTFPGQSALAGLFGAMPVGQILKMVAMAFAALTPLPSAPTGTRDSATDVGNLILYQGALAQHAKRDEQIRTIGTLVSKLVV